MSKAKFDAVKELIDEKQYDSARALLKTIDHATAREWETKLDKLDPPQKPKRGEKVPDFPKVKAAKKRAPKVKLIRIGHGIFGRTDNRRIENAMAKWMKKGYTLQEQKVVDSRNFLSRGYTLLTFIEDVE